MGGMRTYLAILLTLLGGCASAGPVVSNISWDASGDLIIEKCKVHTNFFLGTMELEECFAHRLAIMPRPAVASPRRPATILVPEPFEKPSVPSPSD